MLFLFLFVANVLNRVLFFPTGLKVQSKIKKTVVRLDAILNLTQMKMGLLKTRDRLGLCPKSIDLVFILNK